MGEVFRARDARLARDVALKVLPAALAADPERLARFRREAQLLGALNHPRIAAICAFEEAGDRCALVMELVPGESLAARIVRGTVPVGEALELARQIAEGLEAAHEQGVAHRDLKPANVQLTAEGAVKILDFGLTKALAGDAAGAGSGGLDGSVSGFSPDGTRLIVGVNLQAGFTGQNWILPLAGPEEPRPAFPTLQESLPSTRFGWLRIPGTSSSSPNSRASPTRTCSWAMGRWQPLTAGLASQGTGGAPEHWRLVAHSL